MKTTSMYVAVLFAMACASGSSESPAGVYSRHTTDEFGQLWDTLYIKPLNSQSRQQFQVIRRSAIHQRKLDDTAWLPVQRKETTFTGVFDPSQNTLRLEEEGLVYSIDPGTGAIVHGEVRYTRH